MAAAREYLRGRSPLGATRTILGPRDRVGGL
jgi:hypothetical protein